ncbi:hypothetical protein LTR95_008883 [Oleoguttula sp. CCFEE 5521]
MSSSTPTSSAAGTSSRTSTHKDKLAKPAAMVHQATSTSDLPSTGSTTSKFSAEIPDAPIPSVTETSISDCMTRLKALESSIENVEISAHQRIDNMRVNLRERPGSKYARVRSMTEATKATMPSTHIATPARTSDPNLRSETDTTVEKLTTRMNALEVMIENVEISLHSRISGLGVKLDAPFGFAYPQSEDSRSTSRAGTLKGEKGKWEIPAPLDTADTKKHEATWDQGDGAGVIDAMNVDMSQYELDLNIDYDEYMQAFEASDEQRREVEHIPADISGVDPLLYFLAQSSSDAELFGRLSPSPFSSAMSIEDAYDAAGNALVPDDAVLQCLTDELVDVQLLASIPHPLGILTPLVDLGTLPLPPSTAEALLPFANPVALAEMTKPVTVSRTPYRPGAAEKERRLDEMAAGAYFTGC